MPRKPTFPISIKAGSTVIRIYRSPLRGTPPATSPSPSGSSRNPSRLYDSYILAYHSKGKRTRRRFSSLTAAQTEAERVRTSFINEDFAALRLTGDDQMAYVRAKDIADAYKLSVDQLAKEYDEARKVVGDDAGLLEACKFFERFGKTIQQTATVPEVVTKLVDGLKADGLSDYHVLSTKQRLDRFAQEFPGAIMEVTTEQITQWLRNLKGVDPKGNTIALAPKTRNHYRNSVVHLFNYARDQKFLPKGIPTEAESVNSLSTVARANEIVPVDEMTKLLSLAPKHLVPALALKAFSGIRTEELLRITWKQINFSTKYITLDGSVTKTGERRLIPMAENLVAWLTPFEGSEGRICRRWKRAQSMVQSFERHGSRLGIKVGDNRFRNSYISYRVAVTHDIPRVALESGNSARIIQREYLELATEEEGKRWFGIMPDKEKLKEKMKLRDAAYPRVRSIPPKPSKSRKPPRPAHA